mgnify:CR=1 FL=1
MKQSQFMSLLEATTNVFVGYLLAIVTQIIVFPWFGIMATLDVHLTIGLLFVGCLWFGDICCGDFLNISATLKKGPARGWPSLRQLKVVRGCTTLSS